MVYCDERFILPHPTGSGVSSIIHQQQTGYITEIVLKLIMIDLKIKIMKYQLCYPHHQWTSCVVMSGYHGQCMASVWPVYVAMSGYHGQCMLP